MKVLAVTINSESGDDYGVFLFKEKPTDQQFKEWLKENLPPEDADPEYILEENGHKGPGIWGTYLYWSWSEEEIIEL
jgi:hypothetical protein